MKNKKRLIVSLFMSLIASVCFIAGCTTSTKEPNKPTAKPDKIVLADFETWETGLQLIRTGAGFGKISWNKDPAYVKDGIGSAKLQPLGGYEGGKAQFFYPTYSELFGINYTDFTDSKSVSFDFYNAEDTEIEVSVGLVPTEGSSGNASNWTTTSYEFQTLPSKQWTTITYEVNVSILAMSYDVKDIQGVYVAFQGVWSNQLKDAPVVYLDNIVLHKHKEAQKIENLVQLGQNEYMDFEAPEWQRYAVKAMNTGDAPEVSFVKSAEEPILKDSDPNKAHLSGNYALKVDIPTGTEPSIWPGVEFSEILLRNSIFNGLDEGLYGATTFTMELFNAGPEDFSIGIRLHDIASKAVYQSIALPAGEWVTFEYNIKDLYDDYYAEYNKTSLFTDPGLINFRWGSNKVPEGTVIYMDNMRFEMADIDMTAEPTIETSPFIRQAEVGSLIDLPTLYVTDRYDTKIKGTSTVYYKNNGTWEELALEKGKIPVSKVGEYKIVATATNSLQNTETVERYFEGIAEVPDNVLATYSYADEISNVWVRELNRTEDSGVTFMEEATFNGETRKGVLKVVADNKEGANAWGTGFIGFTFATEYLNAATAGKWKSITVRMCITTEVGAPSAYLSNNATGLTPIPLATNKWVDFTITKNALNNGVTNTTFNTVKKVMADNLFYSTANEAFGRGSSMYLFYVAVSSTSTDLRKNSKITYYIDEVIWEGNETVLEYEDEVFVGDIYDDEWATPDDIRRKEELE